MAGQLGRPRKACLAFPNNTNHNAPLPPRAIEPRWLAPIQILDAVAALVLTRLDDPQPDPNRRIARFAQSRRREEAKAA